jgi:hypothetical protein
MITTIKKWEIRDDNNNLIAEGALKLNGYTYELHTKKEIIARGIVAERRYDEFKETNKMIATMKNLRFEEVR